MILTNCSTMKLQEFRIILTLETLGHSEKWDTRKTRIVKYPIEINIQKSWKSENRGTRRIGTIEQSPPNLPKVLTCRIGTSLVNNIRYTFDFPKQKKNRRKELFLSECIKLTKFRKLFIEQQPCWKFIWEKFDRLALDTGTRNSWAYETL